MRRLLRVAILASLLCASLVAGTVSSEAAPGWHAETLDVGNSTGAHNSTVYYPVYEQHHVFNQGMESGRSVLRHGWFQPGFDTWRFETLDVGVSTGTETATIYYPVYEQHHVFNQGMESGRSVLRHGWFQPGFDTWRFETLDKGVSTGTDTATVIYGDQHHVFTHGIEAGRSVLRHGVFDPSVGTWQFETLDVDNSTGEWLSTMVWQNQLHVFGKSEPSITCSIHNNCERTGRLRHGWYEGTWNFETFDFWDDGLAMGGSAAFVGADGNQNVIFGGVLETCNGPLGFYPCPLELHGWYDGTWQFEGMAGRAMYGGVSIPTGMYAAVAVNPNGNTEVFDEALNWLFSSDLVHEWWDGNRWHVEELDVGSSSGRYNAATTYPVYRQVHNFNQGHDSTLRHLWWDPA